MPIYHIYHGKDKVTSISGDEIDILDGNSIIWEWQNGHRCSKLAVIPSSYMIVIEEVKDQNSGNSPLKKP